LNKGYFVQQFQYNMWANTRVWACVIQTPRDVYLASHDFSIGSLHMQLLHTLNIERFWVSFLATGEIKLIGEDEHPRYEDQRKLRQLWDETHTFNMTYIESLTQTELKRAVKAPWWQENDSITVAQALTHIINHSTDHRAQTMALLHMLGYEGVEQDFIAYLGYA